MPKLKTVLELFECFGLSETYVKDCLGMATSYHNAFESLKLQATIAYEEMSPEKQQVFAEAHKRICGMRITAVCRESDLRETMIDNLLALLGTCKGRYVLGHYIDWLLWHVKYSQDSRLQEFVRYLARENNGTK